VGLALCTAALPCLLGCPQENGAAVPSIPGYAMAPTRSGAAAATPQQATAQPQETEAQHTARVQALIAKAEASYSSGVTNYNANRLDAARQDFDYAVDTMLSSGMDVKNDPVLSDEFERLLSAINSLEMVALKQGNGFSPKVEPAPLDEAMSEVTFPADPALVGRLSAEIKTTQSDLPLVVNNYVAGFISYFTNSPAGHAHLKASLERAGKYKEMISRILRDNGVPQDLIYQAVAESGFQPQALNARSGAGGMWQFMPFGSYGLERNGYFDERFDPEKSTVAYAHYMKALYAQFGDWYLAMAAYDWGPGNVQRVVSRTGYADFWQLYRMNALPAETKNYVPGILAAVIMAKNPQQYGLTDLVPDAPVVSDTVTTTYAIDLPLVADLTGSSVPAIVALNPALLRLATPSDIPYDLHLPAGTKQLFLDRLKEIPEDKRTSWRFHIVKDGETLEDISAALHARAAEVAEFNDVTPSKPVEAGDELIVPVSPVSGGSTGQLRYTPRRGDTLVNIADRFGVTVDQLRAWNHLSSSRVPPGRPIYVAEPVRLAPGTRVLRGRHDRSSARATKTSSRRASASSRASRASSSGRATSRRPAAKPTKKKSRH
jgi:membrane-bound lytic murein transglycosylase D